MHTNRKTTKAAVAAVAAMPSIPKELIDQFVTGPMSAEAVNAASTWATGPAPSSPRARSTTAMDAVFGDAHDAATACCGDQVKAHKA